MANIKQVAGQAEVDERLAALMTNVNAVRSIASAVEGTIGSKGLDTMLVDKFGDVVITNDGITILTKMEVSHPAARMVINVARAQEDEVGDGTTTATIIAGALLAEAMEQVIKGVPVTRVIEGVRTGVRRAVRSIEEKAVPVQGPEDAILRRVALIAGREHDDIADLVVAAARMWGSEMFADPAFKLADCIMAEEGAANEVFSGAIINKRRLDRQQPVRVSPARILILDDALEPDELDPEAMATTEGFKEYMRLQSDFRENVRKIIALGVNVVVLDRGVHDEAQEMLTDAGVMVVHRTGMSEWRRVADHTGARVMKRTTLRKPTDEIVRYLGHAEEAYENEKLEHVRIIGGKGKPMATILVGAATTEVVGERERIAKDAAASVQAAIRGGVIPGGGSIELYAARMVDQYRATVKGMAAYGVGCVANALKKPLSQIVANAGFNPLEKTGDVIAAQSETDNHRLAVDCDTGEVVDMWDLGVIDPALVKIHALTAAGEIAEAILRIDTIIKKREESRTDAGAPPRIEEVSS